MKTSFMFKGQTITPESIKAKLSTNDAWLWKSILAIYNLQTSEEQNARQTHESNGVGFTGVDAEILSSFAQQLNAKAFLTPKQTRIAREKMVKYSRQLFNIAHNNVIIMS